MEVLLYSKEKKGDSKRMQKIIAGLVPEKALSIHRTMKSLSHRLRQFRGNLSLAVILTQNRTELSEMISLHNLLQDIPLILILPDQEPDTVSKGHKLYPRFIGYADGNFEILAAVLEKMIRKLNLRSMPVKDHYLPDRAFKVEGF